ncbi:MAG: hypothetical protein N2513_09790 [Deltaproteobacteria bacterium]|nr:hypothetical protein [Deltaproteobacteria bacterium]
MHRINNSPTHPFSKKEDSDDEAIKIVTKDTDSEIALTVLFAI